MQLAYLAAGLIQISAPSVKLASLCRMEFANLHVAMVTSCFHPPPPMNNAKSATEIV